MTSVTCGNCARSFTTAARTATRCPECHRSVHLSRSGARRSSPDHPVTSGGAAAPQGRPGELVGTSHDTSSATGTPGWIGPVAWVLLAVLLVAVAVHVTRAPATAGETHLPHTT